MRDGDGAEGAGPRIAVELTHESAGSAFHGLFRTDLHNSLACPKTGPRIRPSARLVRQGTRVSLFMLLESPPGSPCRVLGLFPHPRHVGHVVFDDGGLVSGGWFACRTRRYPSLTARLESLDRLIERSVAKYRPGLIVIVWGRGSAALEAMMAYAIPAAERTGIALRIRYEGALSDLFVDDSADEYDQLGQCITRVFFPELARGVSSWRRGDEDRRRRPRSIWKATAGALALLAETRPQSVMALARAPLPDGLRSFIDLVSHPRI